jgi:hypothetical protein
VTLTFSVELPPDATLIEAGLTEIQFPPVLVVATAVTCELEAAELVTVNCCVCGTAEPAAKLKVNAVGFAEMEEVVLPVPEVITLRVTGTVMVLFALLTVTNPP